MEMRYKAPEFEEERDDTMMMTGGRTSGLDIIQVRRKRAGAGLTSSG